MTIPTVTFCNFPNTPKKGNLVHISTGMLKCNKIGNSFSALLFSSLLSFYFSLHCFLLCSPVHSIHKQPYFPRSVSLHSHFSPCPTGFATALPWFRLSSYQHNPSTHGLFIYPHDEGYRILSNVRTLPPNYMASYPKKAVFHSHCHKNHACHLELTSYRNSHILKIP